MTDVWIKAPHFTAGGEVGGRFAPIIKYMSDWSVERIKAYCNRKGWEILIWRTYDK